MEEKIILVDNKDNEIGTMGKMEAHIKGILHRAFSIFIFNSKNEMLIHQRALSKYHSGGLWTNTCCSHPRFRETLEEASHRRLKEEMGFDCELKEVTSFLYFAKLDKGLIEHEYDHIFVGHFDGIPEPDEAEVEAYKWISIEDLKKSLEEKPELYTYWFTKAMNIFFNNDI